MKFLQAILRVLFYVAVGSVISIAGAAFFFMHWEPDREKHPLRGIDVSHHQGDIDWQKVAGDDVAFAYIKASEGGDFRDKSFETNYRGATGAGLPWGAYHFFSLCKTGATQAANFLNALPGDLPMLAPALDLELVGNCADRPPKKTVVREIAQFVTLVEQATGQGVILYVPKPFFEAYLKGEGVNRRIWARSIWRSPGYVKKWSLWQYHKRGKVAGISGDVDFNVLASDLTMDALKK